MKKILVLLVIAAQLISCNGKKGEEVLQPKEIEAEKTVSDGAAIYSGTLPCADCGGIETLLKIYKGDGTMESHKFELSSIYKGKEPKKEFVEKGSFNLERGLGDDPDGTVYVLNWDKPEAKQIYYGSYSDNPEKIYVLDKQRKIINSDINYYLTLKK